MITLGPPRRARRPSLTPMIDVVFLLLVFFMLAARFGGDFALPLATAGSGPAYEGPPRLVQIAAGGALRLNGVATDTEDLSPALGALMQRPDDPIVLQPGPGASVQDLVTLAEHLRAAGFSRLIVVE